MMGSSSESGAACAATRPDQIGDDPVVFPLLD
jgi:hypothetical protein